MGELKLADGCRQKSSEVVGSRRNLSELVGTCRNSSELVEISQVYKCHHPCMLKTRQGTLDPTSSDEFRRVPTSSDDFRRVLQNHDVSRQPTIVKGIVPYLYILDAIFMKSK